MPISFNKTFTKSKEQSHFYVFEILFLKWEEEESLHELEGQNY